MDRVSDIQSALLHSSLVNGPAGGYELEEDAAQAYDVAALKTKGPSVSLFLTCHLLAYQSLCDVGMHNIFLEGVKCVGCKSPTVILQGP